MSGHKKTHGGARPGSGQPRKQPTTTINFRIPISDKEQLKKLPVSKLFKEWYKELIIERRNKE